MTDYQLRLIERGVFKFRLMDMGLFVCFDQQYEFTPADLCETFGICVPDCTQFLRVKNYEEGFGFEFRNYGANLIRINIYPISAKV